MLVEKIENLGLGWTVDLSANGNVLRVFDGNTTRCVAVFGPAICRLGIHGHKELSTADARTFSFQRLVSAQPDCPSLLFLVLVTLQEGDEISTDVLKLLEVPSGATYTVDSGFVRGMDIQFLKLLRRRYGEGEFKLLGLMGPKQR